MAKDLFLLSEEPRSVVKRKWLQGVPFETNINTPKFISINNVESLRDKFNRVIIQYRTGTLEV